MPTLILMCGAPGSGKSTYRSKQTNKLTICPDDIITELGGGFYKWTPRVAREAWEKAQAILMDEASNPHASTYIFDAVFRKPWDRKPYIQFARAFGWRIEAVYIETPLDVCLERNAQRPANRKVPEDRVREMYEEFVKPTIEEGFDAVTTHRGY